MADLLRTVSFVSTLIVAGLLLMYFVAVVLRRSQYRYHSDDSTARAAFSRERSVTLVAYGIFLVIAMWALYGVAIALKL